MSLITNESEEQMLQSRIRVPDTVVYRAFPAETVVLDLDSGRYFGLNRTAARMLEVLEVSDTVAEALARLTDEFPVPAEVVHEDVLALCAELIERRLVVCEPPA